MKSCGVIFDMDGTLFDTESVFQEEWNRIAEERGLSLPKSFKYEICGTSGDPMNHIIERYYHVEEGGEIQRLCKERVARRLLAKVPEKPGCREILSFFRKREYAIAMGSSSPMKQICTNLEITGLSSFFDALASGEEVKQGKPAPDIFLLAAKKPGCREILSFFRKREYAIAMGSSSPMKQICTNLEITGLSSFFDALASGEEVKQGKPAPDIFLLAAKKLGISPDRCYVFEDSPNGIRAAFAAGMKPVMVPDLMPVTEEMREKCFAIFSSLIEAKEFFEKSGN